MKQGFIHITQNLGDGKTREINVNVDNIDFYYDKRIVFSNRAIDVVETSKEITDSILLRGRSSQNQLKEYDYANISE